MRVFGRGRSPKVLIIFYLIHLSIPSIAVTNIALAPAAGEDAIEAGNAVCQRTLPLFASSA